MGNQIQIKTSGQSSLTILPVKLDRVYNATEENLTIYLNELTPAKAFGGQVSNFVKNHPEQLFSSIEKLLATVAMSLNIGKNLEPFQLAPLAKEIYSKYYFFSIDEIALVLKKGSSGEFGKLYDRLDKEIIMNWFQTYDIGERVQFVDHARTQLNEEYEKQNTLAVVNALGGSGTIKKMIDHLEKEKTDFSKKEESYKEFRDKYFKK